MKSKKSGPIISLCLETRRPKNDNTFPVKIRVTLNRERKYFAVPRTEIDTLLKDRELMEFSSDSRSFSLSKDDFNKAMKKSPRGRYAELRSALNKVLERAQDVADQLSFFTFSQFDTNYRGQKKQTTNNVFVVFQQHIEQLKKEGRIRSAVSYGCTMRALEKYYLKKDLPYQEITVSFLKDFDKWMKEKGTSGNGNSQTTISINMRQLRTIFNMRPESVQTIPYPFGRGKYEIKKTTGRKIALTQDELKKVFNYSPNPGTTEERYHDFWKLQFLLNGINITDLLCLKYKNIESNQFIVFERHKTARSKQSPEPIKIPLIEPARLIIEKYCGERSSEDDFIFPFLAEKKTPFEVDRAIQTFSNQETKFMKQIARKLKFDETKAQKITSYSSRHSFASQLMKKQAPVAYIQKQLGHTSLETTTSYLSNFEDEHLQEWQQKLIEF